MRGSPNGKHIGQKSGHLFAEISFRNKFFLNWNFGHKVNRKVEQSIRDNIVVYSIVKLSIDIYIYIYIEYKSHLIIGFITYCLFKFNKEFDIFFISLF